jgi:uncharacterized protein (TIGR00369 family)
MTTLHLRSERTAEPALTPHHPYLRADVPVPDDIPAGFVPIQGGGPWAQALGQVWFRRDDAGNPVFAVRVLDNHLNYQGITHGGMLATLADGVLGMSMSMAAGHRGASVTASMTADFLSSGRLGDWLEAHVTITKKGRRLAYANCDLRIGTRHVMRASGVFALHERTPKSAVPGEPLRTEG